MVAGLVFVVALLLIGCLVLPVIAIARTARIRRLEARLAGVEAALARLMREGAPATEPESAAEAPQPAVEEALPPPPLIPAPAQVPAERLETIIGRKWLGWVAIVLIFGATVFFLKYAFENRWIGELGRVTLGMIGGLVFAWVGFERYRKGWRYLSQVLTAGGVTILYLSIYGAFGYYHLIDQRSAFVFLAIIVAEAHLLALLYNAPSVAAMALAGGFLIPVLLSTGRDQYRVLFTYMGVLDLGVLGLVMARRWRGIASLAYAGTQMLFWAWFAQHYHPEKRAAALWFQFAIFLLFALADLAPHFRRQAAGWEELVRLAVNPFVFYGIGYSLLNDDHHDWMAVIALGLAILYALLGRAELALGPADRRTLLVTVGTALTFVTLAIPVQLESNWITIGWGLEALALAWAARENGAAPLAWFSGTVYSLALFRFLVHDIPWGHRPLFTPVLNRYFLGMLALAACLAGAAHLARRLGRWPLAIGLVAFGVFWLGTSLEAYSYFSSQADAVVRLAPPDAYETARRLRWSGQLALSLLWSACAALLTGAGFRRQLPALRVAGLALFGVTLGKAVLLDISELRQFYRIVALLALGLVLLAVAWAYQRGVRREQTR